MKWGVGLGAFLVAAGAIAALLIWGMTGLPAFGRYPGPYGPAVVAGPMRARHADNAVTTVVMDVRAVDTGGEEMILYAAVIGVLMLLRPRAGDDAAPPGEEGDVDRLAPSTAVRAVAALLVAPAAVLGEYVVYHGQITPGGGFQGGVILAAPLLLLLLAYRRRVFARLHRQSGWEVGQAIALVLFLGYGFLGPASRSKGFFTNFLPHGATGTDFSAGSIPLLNVVSGGAVATAVVLVVIDLLRERRGVHPPK